MIKNDQEYAFYIVRWKAGLETGVKSQLLTISNHVKRFLREKFSNKCAECGWDRVNTFTGKVPLQAHHIDGNAANNREENLTLLCPNCHSLTGNFGNRNILSARRARYATKE